MSETRMVAMDAYRDIARELQDARERITAAEGMAKAIQELLRYPNTEIYPQGHRAALATARDALAAWNALK